MFVTIKPNNKYNFKQDNVERAVNIIKGAFSYKWIESELEKIKEYKGLDIIFLPHPLISSLNSQFDQDVGHILELGKYLEKFYNDSGVVDCIIQMKDKQSYFDILFELNIAHILRQAGFNISLKPETARGKADVFMEIDNKKYVIECIRNGENSNEQIAQNIEYYLSRNKKLMEAGQKMLINIVLSIHIKNYQAKDLANKILIDSKNLIKGFYEEYQEKRYSKENKDKHLYKELKKDDYILLIREMLFKVEKGVSLKEKKYNLSRKAINIVEDENLLPKTKQHMGQIAVIQNYIGKNIKKDDYIKIKELINKKIKQTKTKDNYRIICIETNNIKLLKLDLSKLKKITDDFFRKHNNIACILITQRMLGNHMQYNLGIYCFQNQHLIPLNFGDKLGQARDSVDFNS